MHSPLRFFLHFCDLSRLAPSDPGSPLSALRSSLPSSAIVIVRRHLSFASLLISERSCRWWSRNFRESFLETPSLPFSPSSSPLRPTFYPFRFSFSYLIFILRSEEVLKREADSGSSTESERESERVRRQGRYELHVFLCLSSRDFHDLGRSTSARLEKSGGWNRLSKSWWCSKCYARVHAPYRRLTAAAVTARRDASSSVTGR